MGVRHWGSPGLPGHGRIVQHEGTLHAQQGGQAPGHRLQQLQAPEHSFRSCGARA